MSYLIRYAESFDAQSIVNLLDNVTLDLHRKNIMQWEYPWNSEIIKSDIAKKYVYVCVKDKNIIGTFSIIKTFSQEWLPPETEHLYLYRIAVSPEFQGQNIGEKILDYAFDYAKEEKLPLYLNCWAGNDKLKKFYLKAGLKFFGNFPEEDYMISVFTYDGYHIK